MYNIVIGKRSNLTNYLIKNNRINRVFQFNDRFLKNYKGEIPFFPLHLMNDFDSKLFLTQSQLTPFIICLKFKKSENKQKVKN